MSAVSILLSAEADCADTGRAGSGCGESGSAVAAIGAAATIAAMSSSMVILLSVFRIFIITLTFKQAYLL